jgi:hypothetical protein
MKKLSALITTLVPLALAAPAYAQNVGIPQPPGFNITDLGLLVSNAIGVALIIAGILVFAFLVLGGIQWITSGGDKGKTEEARSRITAALIGLAVVAAAWAIMQLVAYFFGIDILGGNTTIPRGY